MSKSELQYVREHARDAETVRLLEGLKIPILDSSDESDAVFILHHCGVWP